MFDYSTNLKASGKVYIRGVYFQSHHTKTRLLSIIIDLTYDHNPKWV